MNGTPIPLAVNKRDQTLRCQLHPSGLLKLFWATPEWRVFVLIPMGRGRFLSVLLHGKIVFQDSTSPSIPRISHCVLEGWNCGSRRETSRQRITPNWTRLDLEGRSSTLLGGGGGEPSEPPVGSWAYVRIGRSCFCGWFGDSTMPCSSPPIPIYGFSIKNFRPFGPCSWRDLGLEGFTPQPSIPLKRSTWKLKALMPQLRRNNTIFAIFRVFYIIWEVFRIF